VHGTERPIDRATGARDATGYALYHPAAALRQGSLKETMQRDMAAIPEVLIRARAVRAAARADEAGEAASARDRSTTAAPIEPLEDETMTPRDDQYGFF
jgi:hypothetical protein